MLNYLNSYILYPVLESIKGRDIISKYNYILKWDKQTNEQKKFNILKKTHEVVLNAGQNVPYYKDLFKTKNFNPENILKDLRYLSDLPELNKAIVLEQGERLLNTSLIGNRHARKTGGSTGKSVVFYYNDEALDWTAAANLYAYDLAGKKRHYKELHICGEVFDNVPTLKEKILDSIRDAAMNRSKVMISGFSDLRLSSYLKQMQAAGPYLVQGHPSTMYALASYSKKVGTKKIKICEVFEPSGESLNDKMVATIKEELGCKIVNRYGNAEFGVIAHSLDDNYNQLKVFDMLFVPENNPTSEIIVTGLFNNYMPLIRYNTGDIGSVIRTDSGFQIQNIQGRVHDQVSINGETYPTHFIMDYLDHRIGKIVEFQILVDEGVEPLLRIIPTDISDKERIQREVLYRWPKGLALEFIDHTQIIHTGWRGKFRHVVNDSRVVKK